MKIDVNELAMANLLTYSSHIQDQGKRAFIYVYATDLFLMENPWMKNAVHPGDGEGCHGYCVLNISDSAIRNLHRDGNRLKFDTRFSGAERRMQVMLGDIVGINGSSDSLMFDPCAIVIGRDGGQMILRPFTSLGMNLAEFSSQEDELSPDRESPMLPSDRPRPQLSIVKS